MSVGMADPALVLFAALCRTALWFFASSGRSKQEMRNRREERSPKFHVWISYRNHCFPDTILQQKGLRLNNTVPGALITAEVQNYRVVAV